MYGNILQDQSMLQTLFTFFKIIMSQYQSAHSFLEILSFSCCLVLVIQKSGKKRNWKMWSSFKYLTVFHIFGFAGSSLSDASVTAGS